MTLDDGFQRHFESRDPNEQMDVVSMIREIEKHINLKYPIENRRVDLLNYPENHGMPAIEFLNTIYKEIQELRMDQMSNEEFANHLFFQKHGNRNLLKRLMEIKGVRKFDIRRLTEAIQNIESQDTIMSSRTAVQNVCLMDDESRQTYDKLSELEKEFVDWTYETKGQTAMINIMSTYKRAQRDGQFSAASSTFQGQKAQAKRFGKPGRTNAKGGQCLAKGHFMQGDL